MHNELRRGAFPAGRMTVQRRNRTGSGAAGPAGDQRLLACLDLQREVLRADTALRQTAGHEPETFLCRRLPHTSLLAGWNLVFPVAVWQFCVGLVWVGRGCSRRSFVP